MKKMHLSLIFLWLIFWAFTDILMKHSHNAAKNFSGTVRTITPVADGTATFFTADVELGIFDNFQLTFS